MAGCTERSAEAAAVGADVRAVDADVAIIGAGPFALSAAAHLRDRGVEPTLLGTPMEFWERSMPAGMLLRSPWGASHIAAPGRGCTIDAFEASTACRLPRPLGRDDFVRYGRWFADINGLRSDPRRVRMVERLPSGRFSLALEDGDSLTAATVVVAAGIGPFARRLGDVGGPRAMVSHASDHDDLSPFRGRRVAVVGGGQSALESGALLHEAGATVTVVVRAPHVHWLVRSARLHRLPAIRGLAYAPTDVGPAGISWIVSTPGLFRRFPQASRRSMTRLSLRPAVSAWVVPRVRDVPILTGRSVVGMTPGDHGLALELSDGAVLEVDHLLLATGYQVDITRYAFLAPNLVAGVVQESGYPLLTAGFESSVGGLCFAGAPAAKSFGPLMRFVAGTGYLAPRLASGVASTRRTGR